MPPVVERRAISRLKALHCLLYTMQGLCLTQVQPAAFAVAIEARIKPGFPIVKNLFQSHKS